MLPEIEAEIVLADKGFDADERVLIPLQKAGKAAVIPPRLTVRCNGVTTRISIRPDI